MFNSKLLYFPSLLDSKLLYFADCFFLSFYSYINQLLFRLADGAISYAPNNRIANNRRNKC